MLGRTKYFLTRASGSTTYLYPKDDILRGLQATTVPYTFDETNIVCSSLDAISSLYYDIYYQTTISQPVGNVGFSCNAGTLLEDMGENMQFVLSNGTVVVKWRLVKQITPQVNPPLSSPGDSPVGTVGFVTVFNAYGINISGTNLDFPSVIRTG